MAPPREVTLFFVANGNKLNYTHIFRQAFMTYFIHHPDKEHEGPLTWNELQKRFEDGLVNESTLVASSHPSVHPC